jgi:hydrogenase maturation protease
MILIAGLGSPHGDDQLGWMAIDRLQGRLPPEATARKLRGGIDLLDLLDGQDAVIVIDASAPAGQSGAIRSFEWPGPEVSPHTAAGTHGLGLIDAFQLAASLGRLPRRAVIFTIEARAVAPHSSVSPELLSRLDALVEAVIARLSGQ